jgi:protein-tyrosine phosphatase
MRILYVCTGNSFRSPVAEALTRRYHDDIEVESAGTHSVACVAINGVKLLATVNAAQYVKEHPDQVSTRALEDADIIVAMERRHKRHITKQFHTETPITVWDITDPIEPSMRPEAAFEQLRSHVRHIHDHIPI